MSEHAAQYLLNMTDSLCRACWFSNNDREYPTRSNFDTAADQLNLTSIFTHKVLAFLTDTQCPRITAVTSTTIRSKNSGNEIEVGPSRVTKRMVEVLHPGSWEGFPSPSVSLFADQRYHCQKSRVTSLSSCICVILPYQPVVTWVCGSRPFRLRR